MMARPSIRAELNMLLHNIPFRIRYGADTNFNHSGKPIEVGFITGADLMVKSEVLRKCGGFNPRFFMYFEESEMQERFSRMGYRIYNVPSSNIVHLNGGSFPTEEKMRRRRAWFEESRDLYMELSGHGRLYKSFYRLLSSEKVQRFFRVSEV